MEGMFKDLHKNDPGGDQLSEHEIRRAVRSVTRLRRFGRKAVATATIMMTPFMYLQSDIVLTNIISPDTTAQIHEIAEAPEGDNSGLETVFIDGFGSVNGSYFASRLTPAIEAAAGGSVSAIEYGNRSINYDKIAEQIVESYHENNKQRLALYGYSIGGRIALHVAVILKEKYGIDVETIYLDHTPIDAKSVRASQRSKAQLVLSGIEAFDKIGINIEGSTTARFLADRAFRDLSYSDATTSLMVDQYFVTLRNDAEDLFKKIGDLNGPKTTIVYLTSANEKSDYMVNDTRSRKLATKYAAANSLPSAVWWVKDAMHSRPDLTVDQYVDATKGGKDELSALHEESNQLYRLGHGVVTYLVHLSY